MISEVNEILDYIVDYGRMPSLYKLCRYNLTENEIQYLYNEFRCREVNQDFFPSILRTQKISRDFWISKIVSGNMSFSDPMLTSISQNLHNMATRDKVIGDLKSMGFGLENNNTVLRLFIPLSGDTLISSLEITSAYPVIDFNLIRPSSNHTVAPVVSHIDEVLVGLNSIRFISIYNDRIFVSIVDSVILVDRSLLWRKVI